MTELTSDYISGLGLSSYGTTTTETSDNELGQGDFLTLLVTQLNNQDPTDPVKNEDFVAQLAQFSTVSGIEELNSSFSELSQTLSQNQTLQAATLVGNNVLVPADTAELSEGQGIHGGFSLDSSATQVKVEIYSASGEVVRTLDLQSLSAGLQEFDWDGLTEDGSAAPAGSYQFSVTGQVDGATQSFSTYLSGEVQSVSLDSNGEGLMLNVLGIGEMSFSNVYRIE